MCLIKNCFYLFISLLFLRVKDCQAQSKCSDIIDYKKNGTEWNGSFYVRAQYALDNTILNVRVYTTADEDHDIGVTVEETSAETKAQYENNKPIRFMIVFNTSFSFPEITKIELRTNHVCQIICASPNDIEFDYAETFASINFYPFGKSNATQTSCDSDEQFTVYEETASAGQFNDEICGKQVIQRQAISLAIGGTEIERGSWPWLVAIFISNQANLKFTCGGTLISRRAVVSAAHCFHTNIKKYTEENVLLSMGRHNIFDLFESGVFQYRAERLFIHADYRAGKGFYDGDIALILTDSPVSFTDRVRPVCLWDGEPLIDALAGWNSSVVGWGRDETNPYSPVPKRVNALIVTEDTCFKSNEAFEQLTSRRNFCAGNLDGTGPCEGDSGGGLMVYYNNRWWLRGTVSASLHDTGTGTCDLKNYVIYTDIVKFKEWIYRKSSTI